MANKRAHDLKNYDLTSFQSETLLFFRAHPGARILDLKNYLKITHQAARNLVDRIHQKGLIILEVASGDARSRNVYLTDKGENLYQELHSKGLDTGKNLLEGISLEEKEILKGLIEKILSNIK